MKRMIACFALCALVTVFFLSSPAIASDQSSEGPSEGEIEAAGYKTRADLIKDVKNRMQVLDADLEKLSEKYKDDEIKKGFVDEMKALAGKGQDLVAQLENADEADFPELEKKAAEVLNELDAFFKKLEDKM